MNYTFLYFFTSLYSLRAIVNLPWSPEPVPLLTYLIRGDLGVQQVIKRGMHAEEVFESNTENWNSEALVILSELDEWIPAESNREWLMRKGKAEVIIAKGWLHGGFVHMEDKGGVYKRGSVWTRIDNFLGFFSAKKEERKEIGTEKIESCNTSSIDQANASSLYHRRKGKKYEYTKEKYGKTIKYLAQEGEEEGSPITDRTPVSPKNSDISNLLSPFEGNSWRSAAAESISCWIGGYNN
eukprot:g4948.t1